MLNFDAHSYPRLAVILMGAGMLLYTHRIFCWENDLKKAHQWKLYLKFAYGAMALTILGVKIICRR
jgi:hypothetical protein